MNEITYTEKELSSVAGDFLQHLLHTHDSNRGHATTVGLHGDLGAGKTTFTKSFAEILGIPKEQITSPTFVIAKFYSLTDQKWKQFIHVDAYRLETGDELLKLDFETYQNDPDNLIFIEWPENVKDVLPAEMLKMQFEVKDETLRVLTY